MFQQVEVPVLGVIENMSYYLCPNCGHRHEIFAHGGGERFARVLGIPFLGEIPMVRQIREGGDTANPIVVAEPGHPVSTTLKSIAAALISQFSGLAATPGHDG
jgi:ATP-binding protein involved in chromosome partitioning